MSRGGFDRNFARNRLIFKPQFGIENPRVGGSIPPPGTTKFNKDNVRPRRQYRWTGAYFVLRLFG
jgi:hypothetical protein